MKKLVIIAVLSCMPLSGYTQDSNLGNWLIYIGNKKLNKKLNLHHEVQYRNYNVVGDLEQLLLRTGLGYTFKENKVNFLLGYGYILSENYVDNIIDKTKVNEHRIFQQFTKKQTFKGLKISHRYRFEQRFIEAVFKMRFRYFLGVNHPLVKFKNNESQIYISAYNEIFLNTKSQKFDRNRLYGGFGYAFNKKIKVELGYMNQFFENTGRDQINIITFYNF